MRALSRALLPPLTRLDLRGFDRFPSHDPLLVVGNHSGVMEVVLLSVYAARTLEGLGSTDILHDPLSALAISLYGFIPVERSRVRRCSLDQALAVLSLGGVIGAFPQGGLWEPGIQRVHTGAAWLSHHSRAPVLPIGINSTAGALGALFRLEWPALSLRIGELLPAVNPRPDDARKAQLQVASARIMDALWELVPERAEALARLPQEEAFEFHITIPDAAGRVVDWGGDCDLENGTTLAKLIPRRTLLTNQRDNLGSPVGGIRSLHGQTAIMEILRATEAILSYLADENPHYFTYRYGQPEGGVMEQGLAELDQLAQGDRCRVLNAGPSSPQLPRSIHW